MIQESVALFKLGYIRTMLQFHVLGLIIFYPGHFTQPVQVSQVAGGSEAKISSWTGFNHGQISIEIATHSLGLFISLWKKGKSISAGSHDDEFARGQHAVL